MPQSSNKSSVSVRLHGLVTVPLQLDSASSHMQNTCGLHIEPARPRVSKRLLIPFAHVSRRAQQLWEEPVTGFQALTTLRSTSSADSRPSADSTSSSPRLMFHSCKGRRREW
jgi:hypothetical protein